MYTDQWIYFKLKANFLSFFVFSEILFLKRKNKRIKVQNSKCSNIGSIWGLWLLVRHERIVDQVPLLGKWSHYYFFEKHFLVLLKN
jgi:hypothetical protein